MESEQKDYAYKNEISLSIGEDSSASTPSTVTPQAPTPSPRALNDDTKPLTKNGDMMMPDGIDNKAFDDGNEKPPLSSFSNRQLNETANGANKNGQLNEKKLAEAVNLELININNNNTKKSSNGKNNNNDLPVKKDGDVEMGHTKDESYDEYFVPVNEHRKYMSNIKTRTLHGFDSNTGLSLVTPEYGVINYNDWTKITSRGEKLYVTKDKRAEKRKNKLCWILCIGIVAAVIILGILAASGAFSKSETPVEARQFGDKMTNISQTVGAGFVIPSDTTTSAVHTTTSTPELPITMPPPHLDETTPEPIVNVHDEEIVYVPNSLEGQITLSNAEFLSDYYEEKSPIYKKLIKDLENEIKNALSSDGNDEFFVKIIGLKSGSVVVDYRISWKMSDLNLTAEEMMKRIQNFLNRNNHQFMSRFIVNENTIRVARVPDRCSTLVKNNCDFACGFNAKKVDFECLCPPNKRFDEDWNECIGEQDSVYESPVTVSEPALSGDHDYHDHLEFSSTFEPEPEPTSDNDNHEHFEISSPEPTSEPEPSSESTSNDKHHYELSIVEPEPSSEPETTLKDHSNLDHDSSSPEPLNDQLSTAEPQTSSEPDPSSNDHTNHHLDSSTAEPEPSSEPEPPSNNNESSSAEPSSNDHHDSSTAEPEPSSASEPTSNNNESSSVEPSSNDHHDSSTAEPEPSSASEPTSNNNESSSVEPSFNDHHDSSTAEPEPSSASEPTSNNNASSSAEPSSNDHHDSSTAEPEPTSNDNESSTVEPKDSSFENPDFQSELILNDQKQITKQLKFLNETENTTTSTKPVREEFDDTPRPTEAFVVVVTTPKLQNEINIFDMNMTTQSNATSSVYSTSSPVHIWQTENGSESHDMSPFLPESENSHLKTEQKTYSVTENISEGDVAPHDQSPFLPEPENKHILSGTHVTIPISEETEEARNSTNIDSPIVNVIPISNGNNSTLAESTTSSNIDKSKSTTTAIKLNEDDEEEEIEHGVDEENLFGDNIKKEDKKNEQEMGTSSTEITLDFVKNETSTTTEESKVEIDSDFLTTLQHQESSSTSTQNPKTTKGFDPKMVMSEDPSTTVLPEIPGDSKEDLKLDFDTNNELLAVVPLSKSQINLTTTEQPNYSISENEVTEKSGSTTSNFLDQATIPSVVKQAVEEDETLFNRNAKVIPDEYYSKADNKLEKTDDKKLFQPDFNESLSSCPEGKFKCVYSNECVSKIKVCDGKPQCTDYSDEWNCFNLTSTYILEFKQEEKKLMICASKWTKSMSDRACNKMGFAGADDWKANKDIKEEKYLAVGDQFDQFEFVETCNDGVVELQCSNYECGSNSTSRDAGEFSSISLVVNKDSTRRCTANVISPVWAITSASCVGKPEEDWVLIAGNTELNMSKISKDSVISLVSDIVTFQGNDYALLQLKQVLSFSNLVYAACLNMQPFKVNAECLATGWLTRADNSLERYEKIMEVHANCTSIQSNQSCVVPKNKSTDECYNDKGSSLYCYSQEEKRWLLNGIQNQEKVCRDESSPLNFSNLSRNSIDWIKNTVGNSRMFI